MNRRGLDAHWPGMMARIEAQLKPTGALKYAIIDSYEAGGQNWTEGFDEEFLKRRGYDLKPYLPAVIGFVVGTPQQSARFLFDFQRTISELFAENYYDYFTELCHRNGLLSITESYFGPFDYLRCARSGYPDRGVLGWAAGHPSRECPARPLISTAKHASGPNPLPQVR